MLSNARLPKQLGRKIQKLRKKTELTQEDLAYKVGISNTYMGYIEQGRNTPSLQVLQKIAKALKVHPGDLLN